MVYHTVYTIMLYKVKEKNRFLLFFLFIHNKKGQSVTFWDAWLMGIYEMQMEHKHNFVLVDVFLI